MKILSAAFGLVVLAGGANAGVGAAYSTRDPAACPADMPHGAPSAAQAGAILQCSMEGASDHLYLIENVALQIGKGRPAADGDGYSDLDPSQPVYPIRGSWTEYMCTSQQMYPAVGPDNCTVFDVTGGAGICYLTTFGDWRCKARGNSRQRAGKVPGPRG